MKKAQLVIYDLIEQLEAEHGVVGAIRVTRHLADAFNELCRKPLGPKPTKDQVRRSGSAARTLSGIQPPAGMPEIKALDGLESSGRARAVSGTPRLSHGHSPKSA